MKFSVPYGQFIKLCRVAWKHAHTSTEAAIENQSKVKRQPVTAVDDSNNAHNRIYYGGSGRSGRIPNDNNNILPILCK